MANPIRAAALLALALLAGCGGGTEDQNTITFERPETAIGYVAELTGAPSEEIGALMRESLEVFRREEDGAQSLAFLRRRAEGDVETVQRILRSYGYYLGDAEVALTELPPDDPRAAEAASRTRSAESADGNEDVRGNAARRGGGAESEVPATLVTVAIDPGPQFTLAEHALVLANPGERPPPELSAAEFGSPVGEGAEAAPIVAAESAVARSLRRNGRPWAEVAGRTAVADLEAHTLEIETTINVGPYAVYGPLEIQGVDGVDPDYIESYRTFEPGAPVDEEALREYQRELAGTDLFDTIAVRPPEEPTGEAVVPIRISGAEAPSQTIRLGGRWSTDVGVSTRARYTHRNLFTANETVNLEANLGLEEQSLDVRYRVPQFLRSGQDFTAGFNVRNVDNDAFTEQAATLTVGLERELDNIWTVGAGGLIEATIEDDGSGEERFFLFGLPTFAAYDDTDDDLNPTEGVRARLELTPFAGYGENSTPLFTRVNGRGSTYFALDADRRYVLAARGRLGVVVADTLSDVPASRRLYSGGGGSVRGYSERAIGPQDDENDPTGGLSVIEVGAELRAQVAGPIGVAGFVEGGAVSEKQWPNFEDDPQFAAGGGLRYLSPVGPIRLDIGVPLNPRDSDDSFQFYLAIGQAY